MNNKSESGNFCATVCKRDANCMQLANFYRLFTVYWFQAISLPAIRRCSPPTINQ